MEKVRIKQEKEKAMIWSKERGQTIGETDFGETIEREKKKEDLDKHQDFV